MLVEALSDLSQYEMILKNLQVGSFFSSFLNQATIYTIFNQNMREKNAGCYDITFH